MTDAQNPADSETLEVTESTRIVTATSSNGYLAEVGQSGGPVGEVIASSPGGVHQPSAAAADDVAGDPPDQVADDLSEDSADDSADDSVGEGDGAAGSRRQGTTLRRLEEEGEVAADYLEELLDIADIDGDIDIDVENGRACVGVVAESGADRTLRRLVGPNGEVLEALQELTRLAVQAATGERSRLMLDVGGFRASRRRTLEGVAARACQEVQRTGEPQHLEAMSAFERKVVHDVVADAGLVSESEGEDPRRHVVIKPA